jgi:type I restriction enzyme R subunit
LQNYDDFAALQALQFVDLDDVEALAQLKETFYLDDEKIAELSELEIPSLRQVQDYRSTYNDIRDWYNNEGRNKKDNESTVDWDSVTFEVELLKSQEINLDYILELVFETNKKVDDKAVLIEEITRTIRSSIGNRAKESLIVDFIHETNLDNIKDKAEIIDEFMLFARKVRAEEISQLISEEGLNEDSAKRYIRISLQREYASENGSDLMETLPKMSPLNPAYRTKKQIVFQKISNLVEKFKGIGGKI